jgi:MFS superfamily sulfate permease-like transporter
MGEWLRSVALGWVCCRRIGVAGCPRTWSPAGPDGAARPQGMAYAELAGLPPITGLYTSITCLVGYAIFGPSRILVLGPDSSLGPMIAATVVPFVAANGDP